MTGPRLERTGAPFSQFELARGLAARGWSVLTRAAGDGPLSQAYREAGLDLEIWPFLSADPAVPAWYELDIRALAQRIEALEAGLVYANTLDVFAAIDAARVIGLPSIWNIREGEPWRERLADRHPAIAARALAAFAYPRAVLHVSAATQSAWAGFTPAEKSHVIYNAPADVTPMPAKRSNSDQFNIISIGTLCERKGQIDLVQSLTLLPPDKQQRIRINFVGRAVPAYAAKMRALMPANVKSRVTFTGEVNDVAHYLSTADALVHCARAEAFPRVFLEAAVAGTPIIASRAGGAEERLRNDESALFYDPGDVRTLVAHILRLADESALRQTMAINAYRDLVESWTHRDMIDSYECHIREALESGFGRD